MFLRTAYNNRRVCYTFASRYLVQTHVRCQSTIAPAATDAPIAVTPQILAEERLKLEEMMKEEFPKPYDGPERDHVNFPRRKRLEAPGKVRMGFLPDEWFQYFYKKTGVTGPYVFGTGLVTFLLSKEWFVIEEEFSTGVAIFILTYAAIKKFGAQVTAYNRQSSAAEVKELTDEKDKIMNELEGSVAEEKKSVWHASGQKVLMAAKRENVQMQLESEYRRRFMHVFEKVKRRLDYQLDMYNTRRKLEQTHMVDWIVGNVVGSITPQQEKEALLKCIEDLKVLSVKAR